VRNVQIIEKRTGRIVATIPVVVQGQNYIPGDQQHAALAWKFAVKDALVDPARKDDYSFSVAAQ
jgi:hypothetical protein